MTNSINELISLLKLSEDDVLRALLSVYSPCQPGALHQAWNKRKNYGPAPTAKEIWEIYKKYDFRCTTCGSQYRISLDHIDNDQFKSNPDNLQVLCQSCNRSKQKRGVKYKDTQLKVYKTFMELSKTNQIMPNSSQIHKHAQVGKSGGSSETLVKFLTHRLNQNRTI